MALNENRTARSSSAEAVQRDVDARDTLVADDEEMIDDSNDDSEEDTGLFSPICSFCDNGGEILPCEGLCLRSFHATIDASVDCVSLGYTRAQVEEIPNFLCKNCKYRKHQCFACGKLGSSDVEAGAEVFRCFNATCGQFYHAKCVAQLLFRQNEAKAMGFAEKIINGERFTCPIHRCSVCDGIEDRKVRALQFAVCRRCPKSYHRKCLPRKISFKASIETGIIKRAWDGLLPKRVLIYCLKHQIDENLRTPRRDHIVFPTLKVKIKESKTAVVTKVVNTRLVPNLIMENASVKVTNQTGKLSAVEKTYSTGNNEKADTKQVLDKKRKVKILKETVQTGTSKLLLAENSKVSISGVSPASTSTSKKYVTSLPVIDDATERKIQVLFEEISSSITLEDIKKKLTRPSTYSSSLRFTGKGITTGKVEGAVEAVKAALQKLENGTSVEDAKAVCEPNVLGQIVKWKNKLHVYLAPFMHGMRYTSFGRHFTKVEMLNEIADKLQCYVQNSDMVVDFCCGANDFSMLMKEKLEAAGKECFFKNYDIMPSKNHFNFERRDWMTVQPDELPTGSQLIMGLNPPFGLKGCLANEFINKALTFKPKLLILIVPKETQRLDEKDQPYDLIWQDTEMLSGKAFYLPGSVDNNQKQMEQWNLKTPPLSLWSRPDWTLRHVEIASRHGHLSDKPNFSKYWIMQREEQLNEEEYNDTHALREENEIRAEIPCKSAEKNETISDEMMIPVCGEFDELSDMSISSPARSDNGDQFGGHLGSDQLLNFETFGSAGFAPGPWQHQQGTSGWLDE
ncbi:protein ENHANCED DOWNY MILDEW 2-like isoform X2 [Ananas comosus]|uniref:Protein ENHANCED DOWNY MILDEW 2-like isoform X2 n=1 Tax=Ananas comosus TaxID=4615 RepID=A0A6P5GU09_ANACO|nr:protein ENHANCED DOWNY MILDEW 2-like isoform X2 [Ananas comosus]